jgi:hypothetical protein
MVTITHPAGKLECETKNISLGGMYLITGVTLPYGTQVKLLFHLPALREQAQIEGTVRWQKSDGMGVQFGSLRAREVWALNQLFKDSPLSADG